MPSFPGGRLPYVNDLLGMIPERRRTQAKMGTMMLGKFGRSSGALGEAMLNKDSGFTRAVAANVAYNRGIKRAKYIGGASGVAFVGAGVNNRRRSRRSSAVDGLMPQSSGGMMMY